MNSDSVVILKMNFMKYFVRRWYSKSTLNILGIDILKGDRVLRDLL